MQLKSIMRIIYIFLLCFFTFWGFAKFNITESLQFLILIFLSLFFLLSDRKIKLKINKNILLWLMILMYIFFSLIYAPDINKSFVYILMLITLIMVKISFYNDKKIYVYAIKCVEIFTAINVFSTILYALFPNVLQDFARLILNDSAFIYNYNLYRYGCIAGLTPDHGVNAIFITCFLCISFSKMLKNMNLKNILWFIVGMVALFLTGKRGPLLANVVAECIVFVIYNKGNKKAIKNFLLALVLVTCLVVALNFIPQSKFVFERIKSLGDSNDVLNGREDMYPVLIDNFNKHFVFGSGIKSTLSINNGNDGHNIYLQVLSELGLVGAILVFYVFIRDLVLAIISKNKETKFLSIYYIVFFLIYGITGNPLFYFPTLLMYFIVTTNNLYNGEGELL